MCKYKFFVHTCECEYDRLILCEEAKRTRSECDEKSGTTTTIIKGDCAVCVDMKQRQEREGFKYENIILEEPEKSQCRSLRYVYSHQDVKRY
jgi:hypothetical protein